jgi:lysyl-tRNA synthetase class 2
MEATGCQRSLGRLSNSLWAVSDEQQGQNLEPEEDLPEQMRIRREKRDRLADAGHDPYPVQVPVTTTITAVRAAHPDLPVDTATGDTVGIAGRVIFVRNTGKLCFATLRSGDGTEIQAMLSLDKVGEDALASWKNLVDIGDHVFISGEVITSRRGELSVLADKWAMAAKALRPLPVAHKSLGEDTRVRQRYVDLIMRPEARAMARTRITTVAALRTSLNDRGFLEIETPMLQTMHGGAAARPFTTTSNALDLELFLRIAPELFLKRAVVGGIERVFEINRNFRNEGSDSSHSPEFAMLEFYQAYADYRDVATLTRELIQESALAALGTLEVTHADGTVHDLSGIWPEVSLYGATSEAIGTQITPATSHAQLLEHCATAGIEVNPAWIPGKLVEELFEHYVIHTFEGRPTFVMDYPVDNAPLVRDHRTEAGKVEKWDLYIDGYELATGYSELVDPVIQRQRLVEQAALGASGDDEAMALDEDFLRALEYGMPPTGGVGLGVDRLLMSLTGLGIRETILFPLVKPER